MATTCSRRESHESSPRLVGLVVVAVLMSFGLPSCAHRGTIELEYDERQVWVMVFTVGMADGYEYRPEYGPITGDGEKAIWLVCVGQKPGQGPSALLYWPTLLSVKPRAGGRVVKLQLDREIARVESQLRRATSSSSTACSMNTLRSQLQLFRTGDGGAETAVAIGAARLVRSTATELKLWDLERALCDVERCLMWYEECVAVESRRGTGACGTMLGIYARIFGPQ